MRQAARCCWIAKQTQTNSNNLDEDAITVAKALVAYQQAIKVIVAISSIL